MPTVTQRFGLRTVFSSAICIACGVPAALLAQEGGDAAGFPARPIRMIVPFQTGGLPDISARLIGPKLLEAWKQQVVVDNRAGAGGIIGTDIVAKAIPDGYTLLLTSVAHVATPAIQAKLPFDTRKDFAGITLTLNGGYVLVTPPSFGARSVKELIALIQAKPGKFNFASAGIGSGTHFAAELFKSLANIDVVHVAYKGIPEAFTDTVAGRVQFFMPPLASAMSLVRDGKLLALAVTTRKRVAGYEDIPTLAEFGVTGFDWDAWAGLLAPAKTPRAIVNKLNREISRILGLPEIQQRMIALGVEAVPMTPAQFDKLIADQIVLTTRLARAAGIKVN
jgi:tripartite-type tricarboxylate transporter receptor subunit TctC